MINLVTLLLVFVFVLVSGCNNDSGKDGALQDALNKIIMHEDNNKNLKSEITELKKSMKAI